MVVYQEASFQLRSGEAVPVSGLLISVHTNDTTIAELGTCCILHAEDIVYKMHLSAQDKPSEYELISKHKSGS